MKKSVAAGASALVLAALVSLPVDRAQAQNAADQSATGAQATNAGDAAATDQSAQNGAAAGQLQEVVVTAERRSIDLQATPIAITAIQGDQLQALHLTNVQDLQIVVPAFQDSFGGAEEDENIRGMGNATGGPTVASGIDLLRDGILMATRLAQNEPSFDIADIEVLEGPQGTFVGASASAGAIEINSVNPSFNGMNGYLLGKVGSYSDNQWQGAINMPVTDTFAARFAFNDEQSGSFYKDIGSTINGYFVNTAGAIEPLNQGTAGQSNPVLDPGNNNTRQARLKLLWMPNDNFQSLSEANYWSYSTEGQPTMPDPYTYQTLFSAGAENPATGLQAGCTEGGPISPKQEICTAPGSLQHSTYYYPGETPFTLDYYGTAEEYDELVTRYSEDLRYTLPDGIVLRSLSGFVHINVDNEDEISDGPANAGVAWQDIGPNTDYMSEEINVISPTTGPFFSKLNWIAGAFWDYRDTPDNQTSLEVASPYQPGQLPSTLAIEQAPGVTRIEGLFGQLNWQLTNTLQLQVGARENWDSNFSTNFTGVSPPAGTILSEPSGTGIYSITYPTGCSATTGGCDPSSYKVLAQVSDKGRYTDTVPTGKIDLNWTPMPGQNLYVFYARGYTAGGTNTFPTVSSDHPVFNPEYVNDWEAGWKGRVFDGHTLMQVSAYYEDYQNMQYTLFDPEQNNDTTTGTYIANLAPSTIDGVEVAAQSRFGGFGLNIGADYNHSALGAVTTLPSYALPPGFGSPVSPPQCVAGHTYTDTCFNYIPYEVDVTGEENPYGPEWTANISVDYLFRVGNGTIDPRVTYSHTDKQYTSIFQNQYNELQARNLWNASADWIVGKWDVQLYGTNLTDQIYLVGSGYYGAPRQQGIQATYRF